MAGNPFDPQNNPFAPRMSSPYNPNGAASSRDLGQLTPRPSPYETQNPFNYGLGINPQIQDLSNSSKGQLYGNAIGAGLTGLGQYLQGQGQTQLLQNQQGLQGSANVAGNQQSQEGLAQQGAQAVLNANPPGSDIIPYAKMALARALANGVAGNSNEMGQITPPSEVAPYMGRPSAGGGIDLSGIKAAANQFYSPNAIIEAQKTQQARNINVDPWTQPFDMNKLYEGQPEEQRTNALNAMKDLYSSNMPAAQQRRAQYENTANAALQMALKQSQKGNSGSKWGAVLAAIGTAAPYIAMAASSKQIKENITPLKPMTQKLKSLPLYEWNYKGDSVRHIGPMAEDFQRIFGVGDGKTLALVDVMGVLLAVEKEGLE